MRNKDTNKMSKKSRKPYAKRVQKKYPEKITQADIDEHVNKKWNSLSKNARCRLNLHKHKEYVIAAWTIDFVSENSEFRRDKLSLYLSDRWSKISDETKEILDLHGHHSARMQIEIFWAMQFLEENEIE